MVYLYLKLSLVSVEMSSLTFDNLSCLSFSSLISLARHRVSACPPILYGAFFEAFQEKDRDACFEKTGSKWPVLPYFTFRVASWTCYLKSFRGPKLVIFLGMFAAYSMSLRT